MTVFNNKVPENYTANERLDKYIASLPDGMNRSKLKSGITKLLINSKNAKISQKVKANDIIQIEWEDSIPDDIMPEDIPLDIIYEDQNVTVVNKKQGMVTHPACGNWSGTLVNALLYHWGKDKIQNLHSEKGEKVQLAKQRPGIVHRLDKETSGIIITAKNRDAEEWLGNQFKTKELQKEYICIVTGRPPAASGDIRTNIIRDPKNRQRFKAVTDTEQGKYARTLYHCVACYGNYSLIRIRLKTGRTHQIRVHMKYLGCPILGDPVYNSQDKLFPNATLMLHSKKLKIKLPGSKEFSTFITRTPGRFIKVMKTLKAKYKRESR